MVLKVLSLFLVTIGLFAIDFLLFFIMAFVFASAATNNESSSAELIIFFVLAIIHILLNISVISKRSEMTVSFTRINTCLILVAYIILGAVLVNLQTPVV